jgi:L-threonylcarbamoyladenylate synthase
MPSSNSPVPRVAFYASLRKTFQVKTLLTTSAAEAAGFVRSGGIVAFPTETVYGLGANVFDEVAIARIFEAKKRPVDNPVIAHVATKKQIQLLAKEITSSAHKLIDAFFPGPLTVVLQKRAEVPLIASAGLDSIGVRMPRDQVAQNFLDHCGTPVVAPSANLSGRPSPTTWQAVFEDLNGRIDCILQGDPTEIGLESTVVDCRNDMPQVLRLGSISLTDLQRVVATSKLANRGSGDALLSPGLRYKHYSPKAKVLFWEPAKTVTDNTAAFIGLHHPAARFAYSKVVRDLNEYASGLYEFFRECDRRGSTTVFCEAVEETGIGAALMDRIRRAAR